MDAQQVFSTGQQGLYLLLLVAAPMLITVLVVGLVVSVFQAATQINEATLSFVPKIVAAVAVLARGHAARIAPIRSVDKGWRRSTPVTVAPHAWPDGVICIGASPVGGG